MATLKKTILFIGFTIIVSKLLNSKLKKNFNICAVNSSNEIKFLNFKKTKVIPVFNVVFLLVKPNIFYKEGKSFSKYLNTQTKVISCMAGVKKSTISKKLNTKKIIVNSKVIISLSSKLNSLSNDKNLEVINAPLSSIESLPLNKMMR